MWAEGSGPGAAEVACHGEIFALDASVEKSTRAANATRRAATKCVLAPTHTQAQSHTHTHTYIHSGVFVIFAKSIIIHVLWFGIITRP